MRLKLSDVANDAIGDFFVDYDALLDLLIAARWVLESADYKPSRGSLDALADAVKKAENS